MGGWSQYFILSGRSHGQEKKIIISSFKEQQVWQIREAK